MMISTRGRYALRVMIDLAESDTDQYIAMKNIAAKQDISLKYLEQIMPVLAKNHLVKGMHGKGGGYKLCRRPEEYSVGEILRLTEGDLAPVSCLENDAELCAHSASCRTRDMWQGLYELINEYFDGITLKDLMAENSP